MARRRTHVKAREATAKGTLLSPRPLRPEERHPDEIAVERLIASGTVPAGVLKVLREPVDAREDAPDRLLPDEEEPDGNPIENVPPEPPWPDRPLFAFINLARVFLKRRLYAKHLQTLADSHAGEAPHAGENLEDYILRLIRQKKITVVPSVPLGAPGQRTLRRTTPFPLSENLKQSD